MMNIQHVLVPTDFSRCSAQALELATAMALTFGAKLTLLGVVERELSVESDAPFVVPFDLAAERTAALRGELESVLCSLPQQLEPSFVIRHGSIAHEILALSRELGVDLIVMGTHGRSGLARAFAGSVAAKVVRLSQVPVLTVHAAREPAPESLVAASGAGVEA